MLVPMGAAYRAGGDAAPFIEFALRMWGYGPSWGDISAPLVTLLELALPDDIPWGAGVRHAAVARP